MEDVSQLLVLAILGLLEEVPSGLVGVGGVTVPLVVVALRTLGDAAGIL